MTASWPDRFSYKPTPPYTVRSSDRRGRPVVETVDDLYDALVIGWKDAPAQRYSIHIADAMQKLVFAAWTEADQERLVATRAGLDAVDPWLDELEDPDAPMLLEAVSRAHFPEED